MNQNNILEIKNLYKTFGVVRALKDVSIEVRKGEVHAIVGENGAGKSTLMNIIVRVIKQDTGKIVFDGQEVDYATPFNAIINGTSIVYQEINLIPFLTVAENIFISNLQKVSNKKFINTKKILQESRAILKSLDFDIDPKKLVADLSIAQKQFVQIARAYSSNPKLLLLDEPTAYLTDVETQKIFNVIQKIRENNGSVIYISHKIDEIFKISDRVTVLRDGQVIKTLNTKDTVQNEIISLMVGRDLENLYMKSTFTSGKKILEVKNLTKKGMFEDISFDLYAGEILGFYGLVGSGRSEIAKTIYGLIKEDSGSIYFENKSAKIKNVKDAIKRGIIYLSEDRRNESILPNMNIRENITISNVGNYSKAGFVSRLKEAKTSNAMVKNIRIKTPSIENNIMNLSGGNQQKVVIARSITLNPKVLFLDEPTHGIDVGAKAEVHALIKELTDRGIGVVLVSSDLPEILGISTRIVVIRLGMVSKIFENKDLTEEVILKAASHLKMVDF